jgi:hypothetical protein
MLNTNSVGRSRGAGGGAGGMQQSSINNGLMDEDSRGLLHGGSGQGDAYTMIEMSQLPPRWCVLFTIINESNVHIVFNLGWI